MHTEQDKMMLSHELRRFRVMVAMILMVVLFPIAVKAQTWTYTDDNLDYVVELPSHKWQQIDVPSIAHKSTDFSFGERSPIHMRIRKELVAANVSPADLVQRRQRLDRVFLRGYVKGRDESFVGLLGGAKYSYEYIKAGERRGGLTYYLEADNRIIYRLEFTGPSDKLRNLSDQTDFIARNFRLL